MDIYRRGATAPRRLAPAGLVNPRGAAGLHYYLRMNVDNGICTRRLLEDQVDLVVEVFRMLADATRVQILWALVARELSVGDLAAHIGKPAAGVSQHLAKLRMARLVSTRRDGTTIYYRLGNDHVRQLVTDAVHNAEHAGPGIPGHHRNSGDLEILHTTQRDGQSA